LISLDEYLSKKCETNKERKLAERLKSKLYELRNIDEYVLGALVVARKKIGKH
jgi:hypothetical protein